MNTTPVLHHAQIGVMALLTPIAAAGWLAGVGLLAGGSVEGQPVMLAWGVAVIVVAVGLSCLIAAQLMISRAVTSYAQRVTAAVQGSLDGAVSDTAVKVGDAIAAALVDEGLSPPRDDNRVPRIYS